MVKIDLTVNHPAAKADIPVMVLVVDGCDTAVYTSPMQRIPGTPVTTGQMAWLGWKVGELPYEYARSFCDQVPIGQVPPVPPYKAPSGTAGSGDSLAS